MLIRLNIAILLAAFTAVINPAPMSRYPELQTVTRIQYTGFNYDELKALLGDRLLAPYFCMGLTMLSVLTPAKPYFNTRRDRFCLIFRLYLISRAFFIIGPTYPNNMTFMYAFIPKCCSISP